MAAPPKEGPTFGPGETREIALAFEAALRLASREGSLLATVPSHELRRRLAGLVLAEARQGPIEADRLADAALRAMHTLSPVTAAPAGSWTRLPQAIARTRRSRHTASPPG